MRDLRGARGARRRVGGTAPAPGRGHPRRPRLHGGDAGRRSGRAERRVAGAAGDGERALRRARAAAARRADQPPRPRRCDLAAAAPGRVEADVPHRLARPALPQLRRHRHPAARQQRASRVRRHRLRRLQEEARLLRRAATQEGRGGAKGGQPAATRAVQGWRRGGDKVGPPRGQGAARGDQGDRAGLDARVCGQVCDRGCGEEAQPAAHHDGSRDVWVRPAPPLPRARLRPLNGLARRAGGAKRLRQVHLSPAAGGLAHARRGRRRAGKRATAHRPLLAALGQPAAGRRLADRAPLLAARGEAGARLAPLPASAAGARREGAALLGPRPQDQGPVGRPKGARRLRSNLDGAAARAPARRADKPPRHRVGRRAGRRDQRL
mmetsp:Transcript_44849/g.144242  ORF Transcript_44849/g.144242 Transcript_44849/m.144242 type:complete len:380 (+) Transcript_44849:560-1699(+)